MSSSEEIYNAYIEEARALEDSAFERFGFNSNSLIILTRLAQLFTEAAEEFVRLQKVIKTNFKDVDMTGCDAYVEAMTTIVDSARELAKTSNPFNISMLIKKLTSALNSFSSVKGFRSCIEVTDAASCVFAKMQLEVFRSVAEELRPTAISTLKIPVIGGRVRKSLQTQLEQTRIARIPYLEAAIAAQEAREKADKTSQTAAATTTRALLIELAEVEVEPGPEHHTKARAIAVHAEPEPAPELKVKPSTSPAASDDEALDNADEALSAPPRRFQSS